MTLIVRFGHEKFRLTAIAWEYFCSKDSALKQALLSYDSLLLIAIEKRENTNSKQ